MRCNKKDALHTGFNAHLGSVALTGGTTASNSCADAVNQPHFDVAIQAFCPSQQSALLLHEVL